MMSHLATKSFRSILFAAVIAVAGCGTFMKSREQNLYQVHIGQSKADLVGALGEPARQEAQGGGTEKWYYEVYSTDNRQIYPYTAIFENGTLAHWDFDTARNSDMPRSTLLRGPSSSMQADRPFSY